MEDEEIIRSLMGSIQNNLESIKSMHNRITHPRRADSYVRKRPKSLRSYI